MGRQETGVAQTPECCYHPAFPCGEHGCSIARKEARAIMQSSATVALRAFIMLACAVMLPVLAMWGASWSEIAKKFQNLRIPAIVEFASASTSNPPQLNEAPRFLPSSPAAAPSAPTLAIAEHSEPPIVAASTANVPSDFRGIQDRLQQLGATYYVLEAWGNNQHLYRFFCRMAVGGNADYTHCFEATNADPAQAMQQVLRQVESWRDTMSNGE